MRLSLLAVLVALQRNLSALREAIPTFEPSAFAASLPYEREEDRQTVLEALLGAHHVGLDRVHGAKCRYGLP